MKGMLLMLKKIIAGLLTLFLVAFSGVVLAAEAKDKGGSVKEKLAQTQAAYADHDPMSFIFYLDSDGQANYEQSALDEIIKMFQSKMPPYAKLKASSQFDADFDLFREEKYDQMLKEMQKTNPGIAVMEGYNEGGRRIKMSKEIIDEFLKTTDYDGMVFVRIDKVEERAGVNYTNAVLFGIGGVNTKVEMDVVTRVFNKKKPNGYVFNNKQRVIGKVSGSWAPVTASRKAIPIAMKNIKAITVE